MSQQYPVQSSCAKSTCWKEMAVRISRRLCQPVVSLERCPRPSLLPHVRVLPLPSVKPVSLSPCKTNHAQACVEFVSPALSLRVYSSSADEGARGGSEKMTFEEYRKLRKSLKTRGRVAGLPMAFLGMGISSFVNVHYVTPNMFDMTPEEIQPIL